MQLGEPLSPLPLEGFAPVRRCAPRSIALGFFLLTSDDRSQSELEQLFPIVAPFAASIEPINSTNQKSTLRERGERSETRRSGRASVCRISASADEWRRLLRSERSEKSSGGGEYATESPRGSRRRHHRSRRNGDESASRKSSGATSSKLADSESGSRIGDKGASSLAPVGVALFDAPLSAGRRTHLNASTGCARWRWLGAAFGLTVARTATR